MCYGIIWFEVMRKEPLVNDQIYHIFNRGVNKEKIFLSDEDYHRFIQAAIHYKMRQTKFSYEKPNRNDPVSLDRSLDRIQILAYCLMPNHFHFLIKQLANNGITSYLRHLANSYSHYVNTKYKRVGPLFQGRFKNVLIKTDEQLIHVSRYIHLNPIVSNLITNLKSYHWSSYFGYIGGDIEDKLVEKGLILDHFRSGQNYERFVLDQVEYGRSLEKIKHLLID